MFRKVRSKYSYALPFFLEPDKHISCHTLRRITDTQMAPYLRSYKTRIQQLVEMNQDHHKQKGIEIANTHRNKKTKTATLLSVKHTQNTGFI